MRERAAAACVLVGVVALGACSQPDAIVDGFHGDARKLRLFNRELTRVEERNGLRLSGASGNGVAWLEGSDFRSGSIEVDVRGREDRQQLYVGIAFHGRDNDTYEAVYLRPFNFRISDPVRRQHAVQYISLPDFDWPRLREDFPEEFENPVDPSIEPTGWVRLRVVVAGDRVKAYVGPVAAAALDVRRLGRLDGGQVGLWVGNGSGGDFANLAITPAAGSTNRVADDIQSGATSRADLTTASQVRR